MRCKLVVIVGVSIFSLIGLSSRAFADQPLCTRTIYNNSNRDWQIQYKPEHGNMEIKALASSDCHYTHPYDDEHDPMNFDGTRVCVIKKGSSVKVDYFGMIAHIPVKASGHLEIIDPDQNSRGYNYTLRTALGPCVYIAHHGRTGSVTLNDPADGDIVIEKNYW